jgi:hypothetical protein
MKTYQKKINEQAPAAAPAAAPTAPAAGGGKDMAAIKLFAKDVLGITDIKRVESVSAALHQLSELMQDPQMKEKVITALKTGNFKNVATAAVASIKEEANKRNSSFIDYLFEGAAAKKEEEEPKEEEKEEEPKEEQPKKVEAPKEKKKEKEGSAVSNLLDSLDEVPATEWKRITDADEAFEVIVRGVMKKFTSITYAERQQLKGKFISAFRSVKPDA